MHNGNLSLTTEDGRPYTLAPACDMLPMGFAPLSGGGLRGNLSPVNLHASVKSAVWVRRWVWRLIFWAVFGRRAGFLKPSALALMGWPGISMTRA
jgi:hypothetical protein